MFFGAGNERINKGYGETMLQFRQFSASTSATPAPRPAADQNLAIAGTLHDLNNLLLIMATNAALAIHHLPVEHPGHKHMWQVDEVISQAALLAQQMRDALP